MHQIAARVWNEIAEQGDLKTAWAKRVFPMNASRMDRALNLATEKLEKTQPPLVAAAYLMVMPLLWEQDAIVEYLGEHPEMSAALPEVTAVDEAVMLASREFPLDESQQKRLAALLAEPPL